MFEAVGHPVIRLTRVRIGSVRIGHMKPGDLRELTPKEIQALTR
jgi:23S rRNA pseudouridine2605 synthase